MRDSLKYPVHRRASIESLMSGMQWRGAVRKGSGLSTTSTKSTAETKLEEVISAIQEESARYAITKGSKKPWQALDGSIIWPYYRIYLASIVMSQRFEAFMGCLILGNIYLIMWEADHEAVCYPQYYDNLQDCPQEASKVIWLSWVNRGLLCIYCAEAITGIVAFQKQYFDNRWNCLDFAVVISGLVSEILGGLVNVAFLRIFRMARLIRAFRIVLTVRELYMLLSGLTSSIKAMFFGMILLAGMLMIWSIILVEFVHPRNTLIHYENCERCSRGYSTVLTSTLTLFQQIVAGDSWGTPSVRIIEEYPAAGFFLIPVVVTVSLGVMNLILAVIVESAAEARERDLEEKTRLKQKALLEQKVKLLKLCAEMDKDQNGLLSLSELHAAWDDSNEFRGVMMTLEVNKNELAGIYRLLDQDGSGEVDYKEFVDQLYTLSTCDMRMMLALTKLDIGAIKGRVESHMLSKEEQNDIVARQERYLECISENIKMLCGVNGVTPMEHNLKPRVRNGSKKAYSSDKGQGQSFSTCAPPSPPPPPDAKDDEGASPLANDFVDDTSAPPPTQPAEPGALGDPVAELSDLRRQLQELSDHNEGFVRKAEEQAAALQNHREVLESVHEALISSVRGDDQLARLGKSVGQLRQHVQQSLAPVMKDIERRVDDEIDTFTQSSRLLDGLAREMGILPYSSDWQGRRASAWSERPISREMLQAQEEAAREAASSISQPGRPRHQRSFV